VAIQNTEEYNSLTVEQKKSVDQMLAQKKLQSWHMTPSIMEEYIAICKEYTIPIEYAEEEADTALARGVQTGRWSTVLSSDSDFLLLRVPRLLILSNTGNHSYVYEIVKEEFHAYTGLSETQAIQLALLAGSDVSPRVILPIAHAVSWLRYYESLDVIHSRFPTIVTCEDMLRFTTVRKAYEIM
jgi:5'-3' exonuclease